MICSLAPVLTRQKFEPFYALKLKLVLQHVSLHMSRKKRTVVLPRQNNHFYRLTISLNMGGASGLKWAANLGSIIWPVGAA